MPTRPEDRETATGTAESRGQPAPVRKQSVFTPAQRARRKEYAAAWQAANKEKVRAYAKLRRLRDPEGERAKAREKRRRRPKETKQAEWQRWSRRPEAKASIAARNKRYYEEARARDPQGFIARYRRLHAARIARDPDYTRKNGWKYNYGLGAEQVAEMVDTQRGLCAICGRPERRKRGGKLCRLTVDHDHETGAVRALLCDMCNKGIGLAGDDPSRIHELIQYLEDFAAIDLLPIDRRRTKLYGAMAHFEINSPKYQWASQLWRKFRLHAAEYNAMLRRQRGRCFICRCRQADRTLRLSVDHDHARQGIRALICGDCNTAIGCLGEDRARMQNAITYLARFRSSSP